MINDSQAHYMRKEKASFHTVHGPWALESPVHQPTFPEIATLERTLLSYVRSLEKILHGSQLILKMNSSVVDLDQRGTTTW